MKAKFLSVIFLVLVTVACHKPKPPVPHDGCIDPSRIRGGICETLIYQPVCGCDGKTYASSCDADHAGVLKYTEGRCEEPVPYTPEPTGCIDSARVKTDVACMDLYDPVCGCDGKTYGNSCEADRAGVLKYTPGPCKPTPIPAGCIDTALAVSKRGILCIYTYDPVCGCDGITYRNACYAEKSGVVSYTKGLCGGK